MLRSAAPLSIAALLLALAPNAVAQPAAPAAPPPGATPAPAAATPAPAPAPVANASFSVGTAPSTPSRSGDLPRRNLRFVDGDAPQLVADDTGDAHGAVEIELTFENTNPLCYAYGTNLGPSSATYAARAAAGASAQGAAATPAPEPASASEAEQALADASAAVDRVLAEAQERISLDDVWLACDSGGDLASQRQRVESAFSVVQQQAGANGAWRHVLDSANAAADAAERMASTSDNADDRRRARDAVEQAEKSERSAKEALDAATHPGHPAPKELTDALDRARADVDRARASARNAEQSSGSPDRIVREARSLHEKTRRAVGRVLAMIGEVERAEFLLGQVPATLGRRFPAGEKFSVEVTRIPLHRGRPMPGAAQRFAVGPIRTLHPIWFDVGVGPALTLVARDPGNGNWATANLREYGVGVRPGPNGDTALIPRVVRTRDEMNMDGIVSLSMYVYGARYLDDTLFQWKQLLPRPMLGFSMRQPFTSIYVGAQIDPIQFLDLSFGVRWFEHDRLMGPVLGNPALLDANGHAVDPVVRKETTPGLFIALTASTDLVARWILRGL